MSRLLAAAVATMIVLLLLTVPPDASARSDTRKVCSRSASVRDTPRGFVIARLYRNHKVRVLGRSSTRGWSRIETTSGLPGWILSRSLCRG